ncbi:MAG: CBS domain-containing protein [Thermoprotei archaeon]
MVSVADVMSRDYPRVAPSDSLDHAVRVMKRYGLDRAVVLRDDSLYGIITKWDIMVKLGTASTLSISTGRLHVSGFMSSDPIYIEPDRNIGDAARLMIDKGIGSLPVLSSGEVVGFLTRWELVESADEIYRSRVGDIALYMPKALRPEDRIIAARQVMLEYGVSYLPVISEESLIGYISVEEIAYALLNLYKISEVRHRDWRLRVITVADYMRTKPVIVEPDTSIGDLVNELRKKRSRGAVIVSKGKIVGIVTLREIVGLIAKKY